MATPRVVVIGGSAGAIDVLAVVLPTLPADFPIPILVVVHVPRDVPSLLVDVFAPRCRLPVAEAWSGAPLARGVSFAVPDYHLSVERPGSLSFSNEPLVRFARPSIDVLFDSAARAFGPRTVGVLLTGANEDGADGLSEIRARSGTAWVQDPETAASATMPRAGVRLASPQRVLSPDGIARALGELAV